MTTTVETTISVRDLDALGDRYDLTYVEIVGYALRVARGATMLDETMPGWADRIDLDTLALHSVTKCVLGQLFEEDVTVPRYLAWGHNSPASLARAYGRDESWAAEDTCVANYEAGKIAIGRALGTDLSQDALTATARSHGFDDADSHYGILDLFWHSEVAARQGAEVTA